MRMVIATMPRSGSNWVQQIVANAPNTLSVGEIFSRKGPELIAQQAEAGRAALRDHLGHDRAPGDPEVAAWARAEPMAVLALWEDIARWRGRSALAFRLFDDHLRGEDLAQVLTHRRCYLLRLMRRQLPRHVSFVKATARDAWKHVDTRALRPVLDLDDFQAEAAKAAAWFAQLDALDAPALRRTLRYEDDLDRDPARALAQVARAVPWLDLPADPDALSVTVARQDARGDVFERIADGAAFREALAAQGLLDAAMAYPDAPVWRDAQDQSVISKSGAQS